MNNLKQQLSIGSILLLTVSALSACSPNAGPNAGNRMNASGVRAQTANNARPSTLDDMDGKTLQHNTDLETRVRSINGAQNASVLVAGNAAFVLLDENLIVERYANLNGMAGTLPGTGWAGATGTDTSGLGIAGGQTGPFYDPYRPGGTPGTGGSVPTPIGGAASTARVAPFAGGTPTAVTDVIQRANPSIQKVFFIMRAR